MARILLIVGIILVLLALFMSCADPVKNPIEGKVLFKVQETYTGENMEPGMTLMMETEKIYGCCNFLIKNVISRSDYKVSVDLQGIVTPDICLTAFGPATSMSQLSLPDGSYTLLFKKGLDKTSYSLIVTPESIEIGLGVSDFVLPKVSVFWRYPQNSFAYLCGTMTETSWIYDDFLTQLRATVPLQEFTFPDYGEIGYPRATAGHWNNGPAKYFVYQNESDFDKAGDLLKAYTESVLSQYSGVSIWLLNWKNRSYRSWLMTGL